MQNANKVSKVWLNFELKYSSEFKGLDLDRIEFQDKSKLVNREDSLLLTLQDELSTRWTTRNEEEATRSQRLKERAACTIFCPPEQPDIAFLFDTQD